MRLFIVASTMLLNYLTFIHTYILRGLEEASVVFQLLWRQNLSCEACL